MAGKVTTKTKACQQQKIAVVMSEFKKKKLNSNAGTRVVNPKQAIAIALSVANRYCTPGRPFLKKRASPKNKKKRSVKKVSKKRSPKKVSKKRSAAKKTSKKRSVKRSTKKV